jgi:hypothetical protein
MYPRQFIDSFWSPNITDQAFVAISFDESSIRIFDDVIKPACSLHFTKEPLCVKFVNSGDSIINEILNGIAHCRIIIGEISTMCENDPKSRNGNVMWEIGVAHAFRQPEEVILLRNDNADLLFDIGPIRVHHYNKHDLGEAKQLLIEIIVDRIKSIEMKKSMLVDLAIRQLNPGALATLINQVPYDINVPTFEVPPTMGNQQTWPKLFELGIIEFPVDELDKAALFQEIRKGNTLAFCRFRLSPFGKAVVRRIMDSFGVP